MSQPLLKAESLTIAFAGIKAADNVSLEIEKGEFLAIIGPNGSGKTTFLNLCTGYIRPVSGEVYLEGEPITGWAPRRIARQGIARAFQIPQLFTDQTVRSNLLLAIASRQGVWDGLKPLARRRYQEEADELLELLGLSAHADAIAGTLPEGLRKLADITLALALKPRLLLLDEPTSGVSALERFSIMETLMNAMRTKGLTALFVEHDMEIVERYADRVLVWNSGSILAQGKPAEVLQDPRVVETVVGVA
ncbi:MAG: ABC transporter ATP-binding protein [Devosia indica]|uniref:ATP-binding cassette domain-containing protein n=2 Tax=Devosiaceae TaxID=2831106 RepID=A0A7X3FRB4_9HYPH|nr:MULTISPECIES: ATP-binding cassette domain-containing protein [Devosiaceae]MVS98445.1 ATP-binding cassette domain-containing protein [Devosia marina]UYQ72548.1 ATP-binding cassette domain-containing protein [Pelagibacterium sp. YIM 151497]